ncbi:glyoxalase domain-containing protein 4 [Plakobranchus ocellatus]|uniref:Glyoxalase domain-containing protein 4 n=1 Tax=Plakobranchus ocellatus TaxID=259542 RepID=A0AAV4CJ19_9GAST|nr:glyoxalase domain-containing protein 4 [Plakobranchus ocellatus]
MTCCSFILLKGLTIHSTSIIEKAKQLGYPVAQENGTDVLTCPDGYKFKIVNQASDGCPVKKYSLACSDLTKSCDFWTRLVGMSVMKQEEKLAVLGFSEKQCQLELVDIGAPIDHATAFGRVAFGFPGKEKRYCRNLDTAMYTL